MKVLKIIFFFFFCTVSAQRALPFDSLKIKDVKDLFADDYGNIYLYKNKDFSFTKYDSLGNQKGKLMLTVPFVIKSVQNPLNITSFSENAQELRFYDQNLNEIQTVNFRQKFGFVKMAYTEDLQQIWLLDESAKRLVQYSFRESRTINSYPIDFDFESVIDLLVFQNKIYILSKNRFSVYSFKSEKLFETSVENGKRLRREGENILIITQDSISKYLTSSIQKIFRAPNSKIVDKNSVSNFVIKDNKLYLYPIENKPGKR